jgi:hypothetical protein
MYFPSAVGVLPYVYSTGSGLGWWGRLNHAFKSIGRGFMALFLYVWYDVAGCEWKRNVILTLDLTR